MGKSELKIKNNREVETIRNRWWDKRSKIYIKAEKTSEAHIEFCYLMRKKFSNYEHEKPICNGKKLAFDGYADGNAFELIWGSNEETEKDILKTLVAIDCGVKVSKLFLYVRCYKKDYYDQCARVETKLNTYESTIKKYNLEIEVVPVFRSMDVELFNRA